MQSLKKVNHEGGRREKGREERLREEETKPDGEANGARAGGTKPDEEVDLLWSQLQYAYFTGTSTCSCKEIPLFLKGICTG